MIQLIDRGIFFLFILSLVFLALRFLPTILQAMQSWHLAYLATRRQSSDGEYAHLEHLLSRLEEHPMTPSTPVETVSSPLEADEDEQDEAPNDENQAQKPENLAKTARPQHLREVSLEELPELFRRRQGKSARRARA